MNHNINQTNPAIKEKLISKINNKTKPVGSLGLLEKIALQIGLIQQTVSPTLKNPHIIVFSADHGIAKEGVSPYPQEVTQQMVKNFTNEGAAINVFARQNNLKIEIVDAGVIGEFPDEIKRKIVNQKIAHGTKSFLNGPAMNTGQCSEAMKKGAQIVSKCKSKNCNIIGFGEMGIGNTSSSALLMHLITGQPLDVCVGKGTGLDSTGVKKKTQILQEALKSYQGNGSSIDILSHYGGFEIAMIAGAFLEAAKNNMTILVDGFNVTAALLIAHKIEPNVLDYCIFAHESNEKGHIKMLEYLEAKAILNLNMRLGEGTGAAIAYPIVNAAINFLNEMASFDQAGVSDQS
jgi:nicotinate-nucleotide--dimethylbenzimidazole phosphoribosyltransferase